MQDAFRQDPQLSVLVATDAAGEGLNLQRAHLMVNYDLPWNPNRIEQRFGRIHRIGQTEVVPPVEPGRRGHPRGRRLPAAAGEGGAAAAGLPGQGVRRARARRSTGRRCASC